MAIIASSVLIALAATGGIQGCAPKPAISTSSNAGTVTGTESAGDKTKPNGITHYADCAGPDGVPYLVAISAATDNSLHAGAPCPAGPHLPTFQQAHPDEFAEIMSAINQPMPYTGGDANGPCGSWAVPDKASADQAEVVYKQCMAKHGGGR
jgi:hypothetical protein